MTETVVAPPYVAERSEMRKRVQSYLDYAPRLSIEISPMVSHGYQSDTNAHEILVKGLLRSLEAVGVVVVLHPTCCGCDALTAELVWHG